MEPREVCKICYNSTSHKPSPTLTYEPKGNSEEDTGPKKCSVCHQEWAPIRVAKELGSSKWVRIRPRPKLPVHIDFMMCKNLKSRNECPRGQDCSYAHSQAELWAWNQERQKEPRPAPHINGAYQYQLCKHISKNGNCPYGIKCTFAHNEEELQAWLKVQGAMGGAGGGASAGSQFNRSNMNSGFGMGTYKCNVCHYKCNSKKQLEDHLTTSRHRQQHQGGAGSGGSGSSSGSYSRPSNISKPSGRPSSGQTRPRPTLSFHITGFRLCVHVQSGRRCLYGDYCTFAHSQAELDEWNRQAHRNTSTGHRSQSVKMEEEEEEEEQGSPAPETSQASQIVTDKPSQMESGTTMDFSLLVRTKVAKEHKDHKTVTGSELASKEGVTVREVTGKNLAITTSSLSPISWVFEITTTVPHTLQSVVLFDSLNSDFDITYILMRNNESWEKVPTHASAEQGVASLLNYKMLASDQLQVKVTVKPRSGLLGQLIIFQFGSFHILQCMVVRTISESEEKLMVSRPHAPSKPADIDLFWEQHYSKIAMENSFVEETDRHLPEYLLPQQIEQLIEKGKYSNVESKVTKDNYKKRMHNLLYLEEYQQKVDLSRYDLYNVEVKPQAQYSTSRGVNYVEKGYHFITLSVDELLFEGGQSVRQGDSALLLPSNQQVIHECLVEHVGKEKIVLKITDKAKQASAASRFRVSVRFVLGRMNMRSMHYAVDQLDLDAIFPVVQATPSSSIPTSADVQKCLDVLKDSELNPFQLQAITSMLDASCLKIPSLVLGPFGCGKTRALSACIEVLALHMPKSRVLVCTHSNSAADIYVENLDAQWRKLGGEALSLFRLYFTGRRLNTISQTVRKYCKLSQDNKLLVPSLAEMKNYRIVVATLSTSRALSLMDVPKGHFTHIFIDEAAQALESETLIPLCLANAGTKIVLAGDHMQLDPPVYSEIARKYSLHVSLLERLYDMEAYESGVGQLCKTLLTENHRSHHMILDLPSQLFYKNKLSCKAKFPTGSEEGPVHQPPVKFVCVEGQEAQDEDSPSYYNAPEAIRVAEEAQLLVDGGLRAQDVCVLAYYTKQVFWIRNILRQKKLGQVQVCRVEDVQGKEFRALIISTVRTSSIESSSEKEAGFLSNPKLFNTAVTRARQWLVVVGEPVTLCTIGSNRLCWLEYIRRCIGLKSFDHPHPSQFIGSLDFKIVTRQLLERTHENFFKSVSVQPRLTTKTVSNPTAEQPTTEPAFKGFSATQSQISARSSREGTPQQSAHSHPQAHPQPQAHLQQQPQQRLAPAATSFRPILQDTGGGDSKPHPHVHTFASKVIPQPVLKDPSREQSQSGRPFHAVTSAHPLSNHTPTSPPSAVLSPLTHATSPKSLLPPNHASSSSSDLANHTSDASTSLEGLGVADLPPFLRNMVESVHSYSQWCEEMLGASYPLKISSKINDNLQRQKFILRDQTKFLEEQVHLYRDYIKLRASKNIGHHQAADVSSTQQFHFPSALPPSLPHSALNFTFDVGNSYFSSEPSREATSPTLPQKDKQLRSGMPSL